jgi:hypothetical protein
VAPLVAGVCGGLRLASSSDGISRRGRIGALIAAEAGALVRTEEGLPIPEDLDLTLRSLVVAAGPRELVALCAACDTERAGAR